MRIGLPTEEMLIRILSLLFFGVFCYVVARAVTVFLLGYV